jgi:hypothetical protein
VRSPRHRRQLAGLPCRGTLDDELALGTLPSVCRRWPFYLAVASGVHLLHIRCGGCAAEWAGADRVHCAGCHVSFDSIVDLDLDRKDGGCLRPRVLGLVAAKNGIWREHSTRRRVAG